MLRKILYFCRRLIGTQQISEKICQLERNLREEHGIQKRMLEELLRPFIANILETLPKIVVRTDFPVACTSNDHLYPRGTLNDDTHSMRFCAACERLFPGKKLHYLDLGCSGGGLVTDFLLNGHDAVGLEGSDVSLRIRRAQWRYLANIRLFTADATKEFKILEIKDQKEEIFKADVISAWEFMEHIREEDLPQVFLNVKNHLAPGGYFIGSIATFDDIVHGVSYHPTVQNKEWWKEKFFQNGFSFLEPLSFLDHYDFARGCGNGPLDCDFRLKPDKGFHFIARFNHKE